MPFTLTLRLWDIFILEGEKLLTAMSYTVLRMHKRKDQCSTHTQHTLANFVTFPSLSQPQA